MSVAPLFFALIPALCIKQSAVSDIVITPLGSITSVPILPIVAETGISAGYQTVDVLGTMEFGIIILKSAEDKGCREKNERARMVSGAAVLAGRRLFFVYLVLTYPGGIRRRPLQPPYHPCRARHPYRADAPRQAALKSSAAEESPIPSL